MCFEYGKKVEHPKKSHMVTENHHTDIRGSELNTDYWNFVTKCTGSDVDCVNFVKPVNKFMQRKLGLQSSQ